MSPKARLLMAGTVAALLLTGGCSNSAKTNAEDGITFLGFSVAQKLNAPGATTGLTAQTTEVAASSSFTMIATISNPYSYEILSLSINDVKYQSYQFQDNSDSETIYIEETAPAEEGTYTYRLQDIKYVQGTEIKYLSLISLSARVSITVIPLA